MSKRVHLYSLFYAAVPLGLGHVLEDADKLSDAAEVARRRRGGGRQVEAELEGDHLGAILGREAALLVPLEELVHLPLDADDAVEGLPVDDLANVLLAPLSLALFIRTC